MIIRPGLMGDASDKCKGTRRFRFAGNGAVPLFFLFLLGLLLLGSFPAAAQGPGGRGSPPPVVVAPVEERELVARITLIGTAEPWLETTVASQEAGLVVKMLVDEGEHLRKGQVICRQNTTQAELLIASATASLSEADVLERQAEREWERQKRLFSIKSVSEKAFEDAQFNVEAARRRRIRLKAEIDILEDRRNKMVIRAPVSGYVVERRSQVGQWLDKGAPVVTLVVLNPIRVMVPVPGRYITTVKKKMKADVSFDALPGENFQGPVAAVIPLADRAARTFPVRIHIANPRGRIKAGSLGRVSLPTGEPYRALLAPKDALVLSGASAGVFVVNGGIVRFVPVDTGPAHGPLIELKGDLKPGMKVVVRGNERLRPGQPVRVVESGAPPTETIRKPKQGNP